MIQRFFSRGSPIYIYAQKQILVITAPADVLAPNGTKLSPGRVITEKTDLGGGSKRLTSS